ncbi:hypothetical protein DEU56DRAFT_916473 [Suillus clintonianus]|uniref:uncharacterized protein n=1 Tax=Suillus clintonianus TaxID=1904413 RepID=UPI001B86A375|nr:uncharacterized protein DEU56DRAFT_916473 [Suillus clintonianus]KAG2125505.1 hypothetical protein DEU56DRAFT_916473 [Suillus clintonianus]
MSSIPTTELLVFNTTEEFRKDHSILYPTLDLGLKSDGVRKPAYIGVQFEDPATGYMIITWRKHMAVAETPLLQPMLEAMKPVFEGSLKANHIIFNDHTTAFQQPVTEFLLLTPKDPSHRAEVFDILTKLSDSTKQMLVFGPALEDDNEIVMVCGWPSVDVGVKIIEIWAYRAVVNVDLQAHWETVSKPEPKAALERLYTIANKIHQFHTSLTPYSGK